MKIKLLSLLLFLLCTAINSLAAIYYVDAAMADNSGAGTSWATAKKDLQAAINAAAATGDQIWVKAGTYFPTEAPDGTTTASRDFAFHVQNKSILIYGGFAGTEAVLGERDVTGNPTILDGDLGAVGRAYHVFIISASTANTTANTIDGFTIRNGQANGVGNIIVTGRTIDRNRAAGIIFLGGSNQISNCVITNNVASNDGGGLYTQTNSMKVLNNKFIGNSGLWGGGLWMNNSASNATEIRHNFFEANSATVATTSLGGGAYVLTAFPMSISNNVFYGNNASDRGAGLLVNFAPATGVNGVANIVNNTFVGNTVSRAGAAPTGGAALFSFSAPNAIGVLNAYNNIFYNNSVVNSTNPASADYQQEAGRTNITHDFQNNALSAASTDYTGDNAIGANPATNFFLSGPNITFTNSSDVNGADGVYGTADDGLHLSCASTVGPDDGNNSLAGTATVDIANSTRIQNGTINLGAYETVDISTGSSLATSNISVSNNQAGTVIYGTCDEIIAKVVSTGASPIAGNTNAEVWIEATQADFVKRHYEITPDNNAATSTGRLTLYFTQQEFNDFNALATNALKLPGDPAYPAGSIANLLIEKRAGVSDDGTGLPGTYPGTPENINPNDADVVWNATLGRWEVSFDNTGFSGFFAKTQTAVLPVVLINFTATSSACNAMLKWSTGAEVNFSHFDVEVGNAAGKFSKITSVAAKGSNSAYDYSHAVGNSGTYLYRLKMMDKDGSVEFSKTISVNATCGASITISPTLVNTNLQVNGAQNGDLLQIMSGSGSLVSKKILTGTAETVSCSNLAAGNYYVVIIRNNTIIQRSKIIKQ